MHQGNAQQTVINSILITLHIRTARLHILFNSARTLSEQPAQGIRATKLHFDHHAYKKVEMPTTEKKATQFMNSLTETLENKINSKWKEVCYKRDLPDKIYNLFAAHHTTLPTGRVQIKTHKHTVCEI